LLTFIKGEEGRKKKTIGILRRLAGQADGQGKKKRKVSTTQSCVPA